MSFGNCSLFRFNHGFLGVLDLKFCFWDHLFDFSSPKQAYFFGRADPALPVLFLQDLSNLPACRCTKHRWTPWQLYPSSRFFWAASCSSHSLACLTPVFDQCWSGLIWILLQFVHVSVSDASFKTNFQSNTWSKRLQSSSHHSLSAYPSESYSSDFNHIKLTFDK